MNRDVIEMVGIASLVPKDHPLWNIDQAEEINRLYEMVEPLYCEDNGRPSVDPVVLFKKGNVEREAHGTKPFGGDDKPPAPVKNAETIIPPGRKLARRKKEKLRTETRSVTDADSGLFVKGDRKRQFAYGAHTAT